MAKFPIFILFFTYTTFSFAQLTSLVAKNEKSIFTIYTFDKEGNPDGIGTGFFIDYKGLGITNYHVLSDAYSAVIKLQDNSVYEIDKLLKTGENIDLITFNIINPENRIFDYLSFEKNAPIKGSSIFVIGSPHGLEGTVSEGIVSSSRENDKFGKVIQITAPISAGSSGSPVMNMNGNVIGIATYIRDGNELNFATSAQSIDLLNTSIDKRIIDNNFVFLNKQSDDLNMRYEAIEFGEIDTKVYINLTNVTFGYGDHMKFWTLLNQEDKGFYIQDVTTGKKYYVKGSTLGQDRGHGTSIDIGTSKTAIITFEKVPNEVRNINIIEGSGTSVWSVFNLNISKFRLENKKDISDYYKIYVSKLMEEKEYEKSIEYIKLHLRNYPNDDQALNILAVISFKIDNFYDALKYTSAAIQINPKIDIYRFNRFWLNYHKGNLEEAIDDISACVLLNPNQPDYFYHRAYTYMALKKWKEAKKDLKIALEKMPEQYYLYAYLGDCEAFLGNQDEACRCWSIVYREKKDEEYKARIDKYCK